MIARTSLATLALFVAFAAPAAAFDCARASTSVEKAICADPALKQLDDDMGETYAAVKASSSASEQKMLARSQKRWIASRENCPDAIEGLGACIRNAMEERLRLLKGEAESGPGPSGRLIPVFVVQDGSTKMYDLDISLLRFAEPATPGERKLNELVKGILDNLTIGPHGQDTMGSTYAQEDSISVSYASPDFMSVVHSFWSDEGGAHGNGGEENFNIDMKTGQLIEIGDVLPEPAAAKMAASCKQQIIARKTANAEGETYDPKTDDFLKDDVIAEHIATLSRWEIRADSITVVFDAYAIGAYAEGDFECKFPMADVRAMALPGALLPPE